jgi:hypothetical protein
VLIVRLVNSELGRMWKEAAMNLIYGSNPAFGLSD